MIHYARTLLQPLLIFAVVSDAWSAHFTLPGEATDKLPSLDTAEAVPAAWAEEAGGVADYPRRRGLYLVYRHADLWYWFGPFPDRREARREFAEMSALVARMKALNPERYRSAFARLMTLETDDTLHNLANSPGGIELGVLLEQIESIDRLRVLSQNLETLESKPVQYDLGPELAATRLRLLEMMIGEGGLPGAGGEYPLGIAPRIDDVAAAALRAEVGREILRETFTEAQLDAIERDGVSAGMLIVLEQRGQATLRRLQAPSESSVELERRIEDARQALDADSVEATAVLLETIGEIALSALGDTPAARQRLRLSQPAAADLEIAARRAERLGFPGLARLLGNAARQAKGGEMDDETGLEDAPPTQIALRALDVFGASVVKRGNLDPERDLNDRVRDSSSVDFVIGAAFGLTPVAAKDAIDAVIDATSEEAVRRALRDALREALRSEVGLAVPSDKPADPISLERLADALGRRGASLPAQPSGTAEEIIEAAADALIDRLANPGGEPGLSMTASDVRAFAERMAENGSGAATDSGGSPGARGTETDGGDTQDSGESGGGLASAGSGDLPLPGHMPLFELLARYLAAQLSIDTSVAKAILMLAYAADPELFTQLARSLESLHQQVVSQDVARTLNDANKALALLEAVAAAYTQIEGSVATLLDKGVEPVLTELVDRGVESLTRRAELEIAAKLGVPVEAIRLLQQLPTNFDQERLKAEMLDLGRRQAVAVLTRNGLSTRLATTLASGDFKRAADIAGEEIEAAAVASLRRHGIDPELWNLVQNDDLEGAARQLQANMRRRVENWAAEAGFAEGELDTLLRGDTEAAAELLRRRGAAAARSLADRSGWDPAVRNAMASGDYRGAVTALRNEAGRRVRTWALETGFADEEARLLAEGSLAQAAEVLRRHGRTELNRHAAAAARLPEEVARIAEGARVDTEQLVLQELAATLRIDPATLGRILAGDVRGVPVAQYKDALWNLGKARGWRALERATGIPAVELQRFAQSPSLVDQVQDAVRRLPSEMVGRYRDELNRQRGLARLMLARRLAELEKQGVELDL